jgi:GNAT superfamily N-acetyltransferase
LSDVTIQVDHFENFDDAAYLFEPHWIETELDQDSIPVSIWREAYEEMWKNGVLHIVSVRKAGKIIGYHVTNVQPHIHHSETIMGFTLAFYLAPEHRLGGIGIKLLKFVEKTLAEERGVKKFYLTTKEKPDLSRLFEMLGYRPDERTFSKIIGD